MVNKFPNKSGTAIITTEGNETGIEENPLWIQGELDLDQEQVVEQLETLNASNEEIQTNTSNIYSGVQETNGRMQGFQQQMSTLLNQLLEGQGDILVPLIDGDGRSRLMLLDQRMNSLLNDVKTKQDTLHSLLTTDLNLVKGKQDTSINRLTAMSAKMDTMLTNDNTMLLRQQQTNELLGTLVSLTMQNNPNLAIPLPSGMTTFLDVKVPGYYYLDTAKSNAMTDHPKPNSGGWFLEVKPPQQTNGDQVKTLYQNSRNTPDVYVRNDTATTAGTWNKLNN